MNSDLEPHLEPHLDPALQPLEAALQAHADPAEAARAAAYLKLTWPFLGVKVPVVRRETLRWWRPLRAGRAVRPTVEALWSTGIYELRSAAVEVVVAEQRRLTVADAPWLEALLRGCETWALIDHLIIHGVGRAVQRDPAWAPVVDRWSRDPDLWLQRAALLTFHPAMREGALDWARFSEVADRLVGSEAFFVRKALGWSVRTAGERDPEAAAAWLEARRDRLSGLALREGSRKLPAELRARLR